MDCAILIRMPSGKVEAITEADGTVAIFTRDSAIKMAMAHQPCQVWPFQIVELDEL